MMNKRYYDVTGNELITGILTIEPDPEYRCLSVFINGVRVHRIMVDTN